MKTLVVFYSRHGHAKKIGEAIANNLGADLESLEDTKPRDHLISWFKSAFDEELRTKTKIKPTKFNSKDYDLVVIGTPVWDGIVPPVHEYLKLNKSSFKKVAFFATFGAAPEDAFHIMGKIIGKNPIATLEVQDRQIGLGEHKPKINDFCKKIKKNLK